MKTFCYTLLKFITVLNAVVFDCQSPQNKAPQTGGLNKTCYFFRKGYLDRLPGEGPGTEDFTVLTLSFVYTAVCSEARAQPFLPCPFLL